MGIIEKTLKKPFTYVKGELEYGAKKRALYKKTYREEVMKDIPERARKAAKAPKKSFGERMAMANKKLGDVNKGLGVGDNADKRNAYYDVIGYKPKKKE